MTPLDEYAPLLTELELAVAIDTCKKAGAVNAAVALSKHITRLQIEIDILDKELDKCKKDLADA